MEGSGYSGSFFEDEPPTVADLVSILDEELYPDGLEQGYANDACIDLKVRYSTTQLAGHTTHRAQLGVSIDIPEGFVGLVVPRTSTAGDGVAVSTPVIDPGYTGEIHAWLTSSQPTRYSRGQRLVGLLVVPCLQPGATPRKDGDRGDGTVGSSDERTPV